MKFKEEDASSLYEALLELFWQGSRWMCFDILQDEIDYEGISCFDDFGAATTFCREQEYQRKQMRIKSISPVLKILNYEPQKKTNSTATNLLCQCFGRFPISFPGVGWDYLDYIDSGEYFPVTWNTLVDPATHVERFYLIGINDEDDGEKDQAELDSSEKPMDIVLRLRDIPGDVNPKEYDKIVVYGSFSEVGSIAGTDLEDKGLGLVFYEIKEDLGYEINPSGFSIEMVNSLNSPIFLHDTLFARFSAEKMRIDFFDGRLRKVFPGPTREGLDEKYFYYPGLGV